MTGHVTVGSGSARAVWVVTLGFVAMLMPIQAVSLGPLPRSTSPSAFQSRDQIADLQVQSAADQLLTLAMASGGENSHYPAFAKERIDWLNTRVRAHELSILLMKSLSGTNVGSEALMASGLVNGRRAIVILQPRLKRLLLEEGGVRPPFTQRQKNNFMLGLVHEAVHLASPESDGPGKPADVIKEELRAWWEVSLKVVRPLRALDQPMHSQFLEVDRAFRACGDEQDCPFVRPIIFSFSKATRR